MANPTTSGFEGLSAFSTDVDRAIAAADRIASSPPRAPAQAAAPIAPSTPVHKDGGAIAGGLKKVGGWVLGIGVLLAVKACIFGGVHALSSSGPSASSYSSSLPASPSDQVTDMNAPSMSTDNMTAVDSSADASSGAVTGSAPREAVGDVSPEASQDDGSLSKPSAGYATLDIAELRYCLAEDIRVAAQKAEMDSLQTSDTERFNRNVDGFNEAVSDYNSRCSNRSIVSSERSTATTQVEQQRSQLETEGRDRVQ